MSIKHIGSFFETYDIDEVWRKILLGKDFIYQNTILSISKEKAIIHADDNAVLMALDMQKNKLLLDINKKLPKIKEIELRIRKEKIIKENKEEKIIKAKQEKIENFEEIKKRMFEKYSYIDDEESKKVYVAYAIHRELNEIERKKEGAVKCLSCKEYFVRVLNEDICIVCINKKQEKDINFIKQKIYNDPEMTKEYASKIFDISYYNYELALSQILDEKMLDLQYKIEINLEKNIIDLSKELKEYAMYYTGSKNPKLLEIIIEKTKKRLEKIALSFYGVNIKIKG